MVTNVCCDVNEAAEEFLGLGGTEEELLGIIAEAHGYTVDGYLLDFVVWNIEDEPAAAVLRTINERLRQRQTA